MFLIVCHLIINYYDDGEGITGKTFLATHQRKHLSYISLIVEEPHPCVSQSSFLFYLFLH
jgi:hypothetical protein